MVDTIDIDDSIAKRLGSLLVVGGGKMGEALIAGLVAMEGIDATLVFVAEPSEERCAYLRNTYGIQTVTRSTDALPVDTVLLAVKPQVIGSVLDELAQSGNMENVRVVSIAAGVTCATLEGALPKSCSVVRVMPNTPLLCGCGMSVVSAATRTRAGDAELIRELFGSMGKAELVDESYQNAACAISGSGPAYYALMVDAMARAGVALGLTRGLAQELACQTMKGTAELIEQTQTHPQVVIDNVSSPAGTTIAGLVAMEDAGFTVAVNKGVMAAAHRAEELG